MHWALLIAFGWLLGFGVLWAVVFVGAQAERAPAPRPPERASETFAHPRHA